jgi:hypothetical protein
MSNENSNDVLPLKPDKLVQSGSIIGYSYDSNSYILDVFYKGRNQAIHRYNNVFPPVISQIFDSSGSIGRKAQLLLKDYESSKVK